MNKKSYSLDTFIEIAMRIERDQSIKEFMKRIATSDQNRVIVTPNLNHLRIIDKNMKVRENYLNADYLLADGMPVVLLSRLFNHDEHPNVKRLTGVDLVDYLLRSNERIYVIGSTNKVIFRLRERFKTYGFPNLELNCNHQYFESEKLDNQVEQVFEDPNFASARYVLLALGYPKQEELAALLRERKFVTPKIFFCIGGSLDILSGVFPRAPIFIQKSGFEWLWRLINDFQRLAPRYFQDFLFLIKYTPLIYKYKFWRQKK